MLLKPNDYMFTFDMKPGHHYLDTFPEHWQYLGFMWGSSENTNYYAFKVLLFGLRTAFYAFTKLMRPLIRLWHGKGLREIVYLDDGIVAVEGEEQAVQLAAM